MREENQELAALLDGTLPAEEEQRVIEDCVRRSPPLALPIAAVLLKQKHALRQELLQLREEMLSCPRPVGIFKRLVRGETQLAVVTVGARKMCVAVDRTVSVEKLKAESTVLLTPQMSHLMSVVEPLHSGGEMATLIGWTGSRAQLRSGPGDEYAADISAELYGALRAGQKVLVDRESQVVFEAVDGGGERFEILEEMADDIGPEELGGLEDIFHDLEEEITLPLRHPDIAAALRFKPRKGIVLAGVPGTGKTSLIKATARRLRDDRGLRVRLLAVPPGSHRSMWFGMSEERIRKLFAEARRAAKESDSLVLLVFDDFDHLGSRGDSVLNTHDSRLVPCFLQAIDALDPARDRILLVGITNREDMLDAALIREGRFSDRVFRIPRPSRSGARAILDKLLPADLPFAVNGHCLRDEIIERTLASAYAPNGANGPVATLTLRDGSRREVTAADVMTGALLANVANTAKRRSASRALRGGKCELTPQDVLTALDQRLTEIAERLRVGPALYQTLDLAPDLEVVRVEVHPARRAPKSAEFIV